MNTEQRSDVSDRCGPRVRCCFGPRRVVRSAQMHLTAVIFNWKELQFHSTKEEQGIRFLVERKLITWWAHISLRLLGDEKGYFGIEISTYWIDLYFPWELEKSPWFFIAETEWDSPNPALPQSIKKKVQSCQKLFFKGSSITDFHITEGAESRYVCA